MNDADIRQKVLSLGTILGIWAHPDDETFNSGGLMAQAALNGQTVTVVTATRGEKGVQDAKRWPPDRLGEIRTAELGKALNILGVKQHHWLQYKDGGCRNVDPEEATSQLKELIKKYKPDTILTFGADGLTGHPDHQTVSAWVDRAASGTDVRVLQVAQLRSHYEQVREADEKFKIFFNLDAPKLYEEIDCALVLELSPELAEIKHQALSAMPSQYEKMFTGLGKENILRMLRVEAFRSA